MKELVLSLLILLSLSVKADEFIGVVESADCQVVSKSGSTAGALIGGTGGAIVGSIVGRSLFGRSGGAIGGLVGGAGGAVAGENIGASKTYQCILRVKSPDGIPLYSRVMSTHPYVNGQQVKVVRDAHGNVNIQ